MKFLDTTTLNALLEGCFKRNYLNEATDIFKHHLQSPNCVDDNTTTIMIKGYCKGKAQNYPDGSAKAVNIDQVFKILEIMDEYEFPVNCTTYNTIIEYCVNADQTDKAWEILDHMFTHKISADKYTYCYLFKSIKSPHHKPYLSKALALAFSWKSSSEH